MVFDIYYAGLAAMSLHPGLGRDNGHGKAKDAMSVEQCADMAIEMIKVRRSVLGD